MKTVKGMVLGLSLLLILSLFVGCMGHTPVLVDQYQYGDEKLSCDALKSKISGIDEQVGLKERQRNSKLAGNAAITTAGVLLFPPALLFLDSKSDEKAEISALLNRRESLWNIYYGKSCHHETGDIDTIAIEPEKESQVEVDGEH